MQTLCHHVIQTTNMAGMDIALHYYSHLASTFIAGCLDVFVSGCNVLESLSFPQNLGEIPRQNCRIPDGMEWYKTENPQ
jgi:hypothetical protein